jgi:DnaK suppressor protein
VKTAAAKSPAPPKAKPAKATPSVVKPASKTQAPAPAASKTQAPAPAASKAGKPPVRSATTRASAAVTAPKITSARPPLPVPKNLPMPSVAIPPVPVPVKKDPKLANNWKTKSVEQLSDPEIIAMPDSEYMNDKQLAYFRHKLVQLKDDMLANAGQTAENLRDDTVVVPDPADRATIEEEHALELRTRDRERKLLKKIEQSIARIDAGDYGYCDETGEPIGVPRLLARPTATLSLEAQQRRELKQKMFGD